MGLTLEESIYKHLAATAGVTGLVSTRIYPVIAPQGESLPYIVYQKIVEIPVHAMSADPEIRNRRYQFTILAETYSSVSAISIQVKSALQDYQTSISGLLGDGTSGASVQRIFFEAETDLHDLEPKTMDNIFVRAQEYEFWAST